MSKSDITPFYLITNNDNVITKYEIQEFKRANSDIAHFIDTYLIELKPIELSDFEALCCWIIGQLISSKVARTITERFQTRINNISPESVLAMTPDELKAIGLSKSKVGYVHNLATFFISNEMPDFSEMSSKEVIKFFTQVRGVGKWTVQMHLIFAFGRKDILAVKDLVVRKGIQKLYALPIVPNERIANEVCYKWGNLATLGTILAWAVMRE